MKAISLIVQFILFFLIGLSIFLSVGMIFSNQYILVRQDIIEERIKNVANYFASQIVSLYISCIECDYASLTVNSEDIQHPYKIYLHDDNLTVSVLDIGKNYSIKLNNFNETLEFSGEAVSGRPVILTLEKSNNKLRIENG
ncbi:MAG: hypothetical protein QXP77_02400 [Candidatus Aenigmatarchaeota archaeon]